MKKSILGALLGLLCASLFAHDFSYEEVTGATRFLFTLHSRTDSEGKAIEVAYADSSSKKWIFSLDGDFATKRCEVTEADGSSVSYVREKDAIAIEGSSKGRELRARLPIDAAPWYETMEFGLGRFALSGGKKIEFWVVETEKMKARKMTAERMGLQAPGGDFTGSAIRVRVTASGVPAIFYSVNYWFREGDGAFLRFEGVRGGPGTPKTVQRLLSEE